MKKRKRRTILPYRPDLVALARDLRNNSQLTEILLWNQLKRKKLRGVDFHRQRPILDYIVDFYAPDHFLAIEVDGPIHELKEKQIYDQRRQRRIERLGVSFLRFTNQQIMSEMDAVLTTIEDWLKQSALP